MTIALNKVFDGTIKLIGKITKSTDIINTAKESTKHFLKPILNDKFNIKGLKFIAFIHKCKALAVIAALTVPALAYIHHNHTYKAGQIDQKYTDQAKLQKTL